MIESNGPFYPRSSAEGIPFDIRVITACDNRRILLRNGSVIDRRDYINMVIDTEHEALGVALTVQETLDLIQALQTVLVNMPGW